jgi:hypothetical protein
MTKNKQAIEVIETGLFEARGRDEANLGLDIQFTRDSSLALTYDFTQSGASFVESISNQQEQLRLFGTPLTGMCAMLGQDFLSAFSADDDAQKLALNNQVNQLLVTQMTPVLLTGTDGLYIVGQLRGKGMLAPVWLTAYSPEFGYKKAKSAAAEPFLADNKMIMFSLQDTRFTVRRGVTVKDDSGKASRMVGDIVMDKFTTDDPVTTFLRSSTRHVFVPANINHTSVTTGTF